MSFGAKSRTDFRCQRCARAGVTYLHDGELQFWGYDPAEQRWLCARDWSRREEAIEADETFVTSYSPFPADPAAPPAVMLVTSVDDSCDE